MPYIQRLAVYNHFKVPDFAVDVTGPERADPDRHGFFHLIITGPNNIGKTALLRRIAEEVERYQKFSNYGRLVEVSREDGLIPGILTHGRVVSVSPRAGFAETRRDSVSISNFFTDLSWSKTGHGSSFAPADFAAAYLADERRLRGYRVREAADVELGPTLARQSISDQFVQYLVNHKIRQQELGDSRAGQNIADWFDGLAYDLSYLFASPGLRLEFLAERCELRLREASGASRDLYRLGASQAAVFAILGEVMLRTDAARVAGGDVRRSGVVLIDEVDAHLHPATQERILPFLTRCFPRLQFVVTSNSPAVVCSVDNAVVVDLARPGEPALSRDLQATPYGRLMTGHFGLDSEFDLISTGKLERLKELLDAPSLSIAEEIELADLAEELRGTSTPVALEAWSRSLKRRRELRTTTGATTTRTTTRTTVDGRDS